MYEEAQKILDYLPIRRIEAENDYIEHLWGALRALDNGEKHVRGFAILPLHLLFLLAVQYKILRVATEQQERYSLSITLKNPKNGLFTKMIQSLMEFYNQYQNEAVRIL